ncbi:MAG: FtsX-like permease family protein, partial [Suipraeoptans sp.]
QRVAIARAIINDPEILLADEPTGALDTKTSEAVMELLTNIAKDRLVIMVTHNPELADKYANRIIRLQDGQVVSDTNPFNPDTEMKREGRAPKKVSMSFFTAISLSLSNLMTKKGRTFVTSLAGSIGIIGIAAILALANGINNYITNIEEETMSIYPLTIQSSGLDFSSLLSGMVDTTSNDSSDSDDDDKSGTNKSIKERKVVESLFESQNQNDLKSLKYYIDDNYDDLDQYVKSVQYTYEVTPQIYLPDTSKSINQVNPDSLLSSYGIGGGGMSAIFGGAGGMTTFYELPGDNSMYDYQYDIKAGRWPQNYDEAVIVLSADGSVTDYDLYVLGLRDRTELKSMLDIFINNPDEDNEVTTEDINVTNEELMSASFKVISSSEKYTHDDEYNVWMDKSDNTDYMKQVIANGIDLKIVGVVQADPDATATSLSPGINYTPELIMQLMDKAGNTQIVKEQLANPSINVITGKTFAEEKEESNNSDFEFSDLITVDESAIENAFNFDTSAINLDMSGLSNLDINLDGLQMPDLNLEDLTSQLSGQINVPTEDLMAIMNGVIADFTSDPANIAVTDPQDLVDNFTAYISNPDVQAALGAQVGQLVSDNQIDAILTEAIQGYIGGVLQSYMGSAMEILQSQLTSQITNQMTSMMAQLPTQLQNAMSIDPNAFASAFQVNMGEDEILDLMTAMMTQSESTYDNNLSTLGYANEDTPSQINIYPMDFNSKAEVEDFLDTYNKDMEAAGKEDQVISYTDIVGTMMSSVTDIVDTISYALIAFVAISLVVSSIMIGVITYISVLERKKEIGILRAIGASKGDIRTVFNAETLIIGFIAGIIGIAATQGISVIANIIVYNSLGIEKIAQLPLDAGLALIGISMLLAFVSGLMPSSAAARKDPVEALRSE